MKVKSKIKSGELKEGLWLTRGTRYLGSTKG